MQSLTWDDFLHGHISRGTSNLMTDTYSTVQRSSEFHNSTESLPCDASDNKETVCKFGGLRPVRRGQTGVGGEGIMCTT